MTRDLVGLDPVDLAPVGEEQQVGVGRGVEELGDEIVVVVLQLGPGDPTPTAAALGSELVGRTDLM